MTEVKKEKEVARFSKEQLLSSGRFSRRKDLLCAVLEDGRLYSLEEAGAEIRKFMERKVK